MGDEESYRAWKDRCERYFTSISESESVKNGGQEKNKHLKKWRTLHDVTSEDLSKSNTTSNFDRAKQWLSVLDIHGLGVAGTTPNALETAIWIIISCVAFSGFVFLVYLSFSVYIQQSSSYEMEQADGTLTSAPFVTVCNKNKLRYSVVASSANRFRDLLVPMTTATMLTPSPLLQNGSDAIRSDPFYSFIHNLLNKDEYDKMISEIDSSFLPYAMMTSPNDWYTVYSASLRDGFHILRQAVSPTAEEFWKLGHYANKTLIQCLYNGQPCSE